MFGYVKEVNESKDEYTHNMNCIGVGACLKYNVNGILTTNVNGESHETVSGLKKTFSNKYINLAKSGIVHATETGNVIEQSISGVVAHKASTVLRIGSTITDTAAATINHDQATFNGASKIF